MNWKFTLAIITCNIVMMSSSYTMLIPFLPLYLQIELGADDSNINLWSGACFAISFAITAIMAPIWGKMSDVHGSKAMIIRSGLMIALTYFLASFTQTPWQLFLVRALQGFAAGMWPACLSLMSSTAPKNRIGICMGTMTSANITGTIIGPLMGGVFAQYFGMRNCFLIGAALIAAVVFVTIFFVKEAPKSEAQLQLIANRKKGIKGESVVLKLLSRKTIRYVMIVGIIANGVLMLIQPMLTLYIKQLTNGSDNLLVLSGIVFSMVGIAGAIAAPIWGTKGQKHGFYNTLRIALLLAGVMIFMQTFTNSLISFVIMQFIVGLGFSGIFPSANSIMVTHTDQSERGAAFGLFFSAQMIGGTIGPLLSGFLTSLIEMNYIFSIAGCLLVLGCIHLTIFASKSFKAVISNDASSKDKSSNQELIDKLKAEIVEEEMTKHK